MSLKRNIHRQQNSDCIDLYDADDYQAIEKDSSKSANRHIHRNNASDSMRGTCKSMARDEASCDSGRQTIKNNYVAYGHRSMLVVGQKKASYGRGTLHSIKDPSPSHAFVEKLDDYLNQIKNNEASVKNLMRRHSSAVGSIKHASRRTSMVSSASQKRDKNMMSIIKEQNGQIQNLKLDITELSRKYKKLQKKVVELESNQCENCSKKSTSKGINDLIASQQQLFGRTKSGLLNFSSGKLLQSPKIVESVLIDDRKKSLHILTNFNKHIGFLKHTKKSSMKHSLLESSKAPFLESANLSTVIRHDKLHTTKQLPTKPLDHTTRGAKFDPNYLKSGYQTIPTHDDGHDSQHMARRQSQAASHTDRDRRSSFAVKLDRICFDNAQAKTYQIGRQPYVAK